MSYTLGCGGFRLEHRWVHRFDLHLPTHPQHDLANHAQFYYTHAGLWVGQWPQSLHHPSSTHDRGYGSRSVAHGNATSSEADHGPAPQRCRDTSATTQESDTIFTELNVFYAFRMPCQVQRIAADGHKSPSTHWEDGCQCHRDAQGVVVRAYRELDKLVGISYNYDERRAGMAAGRKTADIRLPEDEARLAQMLRALGNRTRFEIVKALSEQQGWTCGDVVASTVLAQSTVSQHLKVLREAGLIQGDADGATTCYRINPNGVRWLRRQIQQWLPGCCPPSGRRQRTARRRAG